MPKIYWGSLLGGAAEGLERGQAYRLREDAASQQKALFQLLLRERERQAADAEALPGAAESAMAAFAPASGVTGQRAPASPVEPALGADTSTPDLGLEDVRAITTQPGPRSPMDIFRTIGGKNLALLSRSAPAYLSTLHAAQTEEAQTQGRQALGTLLAEPPPKNPAETRAWLTRAYGIGVRYKLPDTQTFAKSLIDLSVKEPETANQVVQSFVKELDASDGTAKGTKAALARALASTPEAGQWLLKNAKDPLADLVRTFGPKEKVGPFVVGKSLVSETGQPLYTAPQPPVTKTLADGTVLQIDPETNDVAVLRKGTGKGEYISTPRGLAHIPEGGGPPMLVPGLEAREPRTVAPNTPGGIAAAEGLAPGTPEYTARVVELTKELSGARGRAKAEGPLTLDEARRRLDGIRKERSDPGLYLMPKHEREGRLNELKDEESALRQYLLSLEQQRGVAPAAAPPAAAPTPPPALPARSPLSEFILGLERTPPAPGPRPLPGRTPVAPIAPVAVPPALAAPTPPVAEAAPAPSGTPSPLADLSPAQQQAMKAQRDAIVTRRYPGRPWVQLTPAEKHDVLLEMSGQNARR